MALRAVWIVACTAMTGRRDAANHALSEGLALVSYGPPRGGRGDGRGESRPYGLVRDYPSQPGD